MVPRISGLASAVVIACVALSGAAAQAPAGDASTALARYVGKPDDTYRWTITTRYQAKNAEVIGLLLQSQTWQGAVWKHQVLVIRPRRVAKADHAVLIVGGGRWHEEYAETHSDREPLPEGGDLFIRIARELRSVVIVLGEVPFQPLFDLSEDRLIAHTFDEYLRTGDDEWPLLLPMVKSTIRAMDAVDAAARQEWNEPLRTFTVFGGSKRGWTTWLTAAVEPRVTALAPTVIDALNMAKHFPHQTEAFGAPSEAIRPYTDLGLTEILADERGASLRAIVDPYSYRAAIKQPKLIVLGTNDQYFPLDSLNFYWDGLEGPKYILYMPNEPHDIRHSGPVFRSLRALNDSLTGEEALPSLQWEFVWRDGGALLCVRSEPKARAIRLWSATSDDRDFRDATWTGGDELPGGKLAEIAVQRPATGYLAAFAQADFGHGLHAYSLTTNLAVLAAAPSEDFGQRPTGVAGVCSSAPRRR
jgi:PhoPQ-activated pathogenicity-related protein